MVYVIGCYCVSLVCLSIEHQKQNCLLQPYVVTWPLQPMTIKCINKSFLVVKEQFSDVVLNIV